MKRWLIVIDTSDVAVCTMASCSLTSTTACAVATESVTFTGTVVLASTVMPLTSLSVNPCAFTASVYAPGGTRPKRKLPSDPVVCCCLIPVPSLVNVTSAFGTTAPELSATLPVTTPSTLCALTAFTHVNVRDARTTPIQTLRMVDHPLTRFEDGSVTNGPVLNKYAGII